MTRKLARWGALLVAIFLAGSAVRGDAACLFEPQGEEHVNAIIDARTFRLRDGREIRLAGIEPTSGQEASSASLATLIDGRDIRLRGPDDAPDRYGRQSAFVFVDNAEVPVQIELLMQGQALFSGLISDKTCADDLAAAETAARRLRLGVWANAAAIKNAERPDDILAVVGQFAVVEGKVLSVRQAGTTFYINFGRRWTEGFAATISGRTMTALESSGLVPKTLENRRIRVRGWVEQRSGPRIEIFRPGQIELTGEK